MSGNHIKTLILLLPKIKKNNQVISTISYYSKDIYKYQFRGNNNNEIISDNHDYISENSKPILFLVLFSDSTVL